MSSAHTVVWIDHEQAHVIHFSAETHDEVTVRSSKRDGHLHHKSGAAGSGHAAENQGYYHAVAKVLKGAAMILIAGPASAKNELAKHLEAHDKALSGRVAGVETLDHPSDGQLLAFARKYFDAADKMQAQK